jgi:hypothetical protein
MFQCFTIAIRAICLTFSKHSPYLFTPHLENVTTIMNNKRISVLPFTCFLFLIALSLTYCSSSSHSTSNVVEKSDTTRSISPWLSRATNAKKTPNADGFIQRWSLLEPIIKPNRSNTVFVDSYIRNAFDTLYFPNQFTIVPKDGDKVNVGQQELTWHALETNNFNMKLYRFAYGLNKPVYGVVFWAVTVINAPSEMKNVRMAVGSNSASIWWLNGKEAAILSGDRRMVMDDVISNRLTLQSGKNIIRGAVINGPGMSDFCVRFLDEKGEPVRNLTITTE